MKWAHLPMAGGIYDQNPALIDRFWYLLAERSKHQEQERRKQEAKSGGGRARNRPSMGERVR